MNPSSSKNLSTTLIVVALILIAGGLYWFLSGSTGSAPSPLTETSAQGSSVFTLTGALSSVTFDTSLFSDPRFASLHDISTPVNPEPQGRSDPFAPL